MLYCHSFFIKENHFYQVKKVNCLGMCYFFVGKIGDIYDVISTSFRRHFLVLVGNFDQILLVS